MRCLVVGGTGFLGGAITGALLRERYAVTLLTRGQSANPPKTGARILTADRHAGLDALSGECFDWVFDSCAYTPGAVETLLGALATPPARYCLVSSISVYGSYKTPRLDETMPVPGPEARDHAAAARVPPHQRASAFAYGASYGPLKRGCEIAAERILGARATSLRIGLLVGAGDYTDRLTWWVRRLDGRSGRFPAPAPLDRPVQLIDVRDVAGFALNCAQNARPGLWNVTGQPLGFDELLREIAAATGAQARPHWVSEAAILEAGIQPWTELPLMAPAAPAFRHFMNVSTAKARAAGLTSRPLGETLAELLRWDRTRRDRKLRCGLRLEQEAALLDA